MYDLFGAKITKEQTAITVDDIAKTLSEKVPDLWRMLYTKHINNPGSHYGFKVVATSLCSSILEAKYQSVAANMAVNASLMMQHNFPTYYVSRSVTEALLHTHPPADMTWEEIFFPFDSLIFMLPKDLIHEPAGADGQDFGRGIIYVGVSKMPEGKLQVPLHITVDNKASRISVFWTLGNGATVQDCTFPPSQKLEPSPGWIDSQTEQSYRITGTSQYAGPTGEFASYMAGLAANFLLLMQARKHIVEHGQRSKKTLGNGTAIYEPNWIGRKYEIIRRTPKASTGAHYTELDWRAGHYRKQHYGKNRTEEKIILIDPYLAFTRGLVR